MRRAGLLGLLGGEAEGQRVIEIRQPVAEVVIDPGRQQAPLQSLIEQNIVPQLHDRALERAAHGRLDGVGEPALAIQLGQPRIRGLLEGETFLARALLRREVAQGQHIGVHDLEHLIGIGHGGPEKHVEQPLGRAERLAVGRGDTLAALQNQQRGAGDGVERLEAAVDQGRQTAEAGEVVVAFSRDGEKREKDQPCANAGTRSATSRAAGQRGPAAEPE